MSKKNVIEQFETDRLIIRMPKISDTPEIYEAILESMEELKPWMPWAKNSTLETTEESTRMAVSKFISREDLRYHFHDKISGRFLVGSGLHRIDWDVPKFEIGYWCRTSEVGNGFVTEGVSALTAMAFKQLEAARVEIRCSEKNKRSIAVAKRLGFLHEGTLVNNLKNPKGELINTMIFAKTSLSG